MVVPSDRTGRRSVVLRRWYDHRDHSQDTIIIEAANRYGLDPALVKAVVWQESRFNPRAKGKAGERGLMQVGKDAASEWAQAEKISSYWPGPMFDPRQNTSAGSWYLSKLLRRYPQTDNPLAYALADYNAGRSRVLDWNKGAASTNSALFISQIRFPSTKDYVRSVLRRYEHYRTIFPKDRPRSAG